MYSVSTSSITAPTRGEPALIYLLSKIQLQALSLPKCYRLILWCIFKLFYPFQKKDESIHFYPVREMKSHLNWRVTKQKEESLYWISPVRRGYWNVGELKILSTLANGEPVWSASFCPSLFIKKKNIWKVMQKAGSFARFILTKIYSRNEDAGMMQHSSEALHFRFTHAECISLLTVSSCNIHLCT